MMIHNDTNNLEAKEEFIFEPTFKDPFEEMATGDLNALVEFAFKGIFGMNNLPGQVADVRDMVLKLESKGKFTPDAETLLRRTLFEQLDTLQRYCRLWLSDNPDPEELGRIWHEQTASLERWQLFVNSFKNLKDLFVAHKVAYRSHQIEPLSFQNEEERKLWLTQFKNQQQDFVKGDNKTQIALLSQDELILSPVHRSLFDLLLDKTPKKISYLLHNLFGKRTLDEANRTRLSKRVSELNATLKKNWGPPPGKRWIVRVTSQGEDAYQLLEP
jgi:hypothetical protein